MYVKEFDNPYIYYTTEKAEDKNASFQWNLLDTARPVSRWYYVGKGGDTKCPTYLSYPPKRQYHRGLTQDNVMITYAGGPAMSFNLYGPILLAGQRPASIVRLLPGEEGIFKDHTLVKKEDGHRFNVWFRTRIVAYYDTVNKTVHFISPRFQQEVEEAVVGLDKWKKTFSGRYAATTEIPQANKPKSRVNPMRVAAWDEVLQRPDDEQDVVYRAAMRAFRELEAQYDMEREPQNEF